MAMRDRDRSNTGLQTIEVAKHARELTHREDFARNGDYLGRQPGDVSGRNHFDEEYFVDGSGSENEAEVSAAKAAKQH